MGHHSVFGKKYEFEKSVEMESIFGIPRIGMNLNEIGKEGKEEKKDVEGQEVED